MVVGAERDRMGGTERTGFDPATSAPGQLSETEFGALYERVRSQVPWGPGDRRGALNYLTPARVLAAIEEVRLGSSGESFDDLKAVTAGK